MYILMEYLPDYENSQMNIVEVSPKMISVNKYFTANECSHEYKVGKNTHFNLNNGGRQLILIPYKNTDGKVNII